MVDEHNPFDKATNKKDSYATKNQTPWGSIINGFDVDPDEVRKNVKPRRNWGWLVAVIVVVVVLALSVALWFAVREIGNKTSSMDTQQPTTTQTKKAKPKTKTAAWSNMIGSAGLQDPPEGATTVSTKDGKTTLANADNTQDVVTWPKGSTFTPTKDNVVLNNRPDEGWIGSLAVGSDTADVYLVKAAGQSAVFLSSSSPKTVDVKTVPFATTMKLDGDDALVLSTKNQNALVVTGKAPVVSAVRSSVSLFQSNYGE